MYTEDIGQRTWGQGGLAIQVVNNYLIIYSESDNNYVGIINSSKPIYYFYNENNRHKMINIMRGTKKLTMLYFNPYFFIICSLLPLQWKGTMASKHINE